MKITICGSMVFLDQMLQVQKDLQNLGHEVKIPLETIQDDQGKEMTSQEFHALRKTASQDNPWIWQRKGEAIQAHFDKVVWSDAILVLNYDKNGVSNYIGGNTLLEVGLAFHLKKKIYFLNEIPEVNYKEELLGMQPIIIGNDLNLIQ